MMLRCTICERTYDVADGYIDLMPPSEGGETSHTSLYVAHEEEFSDTSITGYFCAVLGAVVRPRRYGVASDRRSLIELGAAT